MIISASALVKKRPSIPKRKWYSELLVFKVSIKMVVSI